MTLTSTYDHRIIQGAESGMFLKAVHERLLGEHGFYHDVFRALGVPYEEVHWRRDVSPLDREEALLHKQMQVATLIRAYRARGHRIADLDPLDWKEPGMPDELDPATYGLTIWDLDREFLTGGVAGKERMRLGALLGVLRDAYCRSIGIEYMHIQDTDEQRWIQSKVEGVKFQLDSDGLRHLLERLNAAEALERFLATKYVGTKRFGLEGAESAIPILDTVLSAAADAELDGTVIGMAHRGRLNVLANIVGKSYDQIFREFEGYVDPTSVQGSGDVKYHLGAVGKYVSQSGADIKVELAANPSHLETVDPIVLGMVRARQDQIDPPGSYPWLSILIHGDAAFAGQGVVAECLAMSDIEGYRVGGTIHLIINNQIGFTTSPQFARSSPYSTDMAKMLQSPIFHVNGDDPEACVRVAALAFEYRQKFHKDVVIDMVCYRRQGHNEGDDPSYTQPLMYKAIAERRSVRKQFVEAVVKRGELTLDEAEETLADFHRRLQVALDETRQSAPAPTRAARPPAPRGVLPHVPTGVDRAVLDTVFDHLTEYPEGFTPHPKLVKQFESRSQLYHQGGEVEWSTAEALAFGSLVLEGTDIRLAGEDSRRGTFSQRHATLIDFEDERRWTPLNDLPGTTARFRVYDSLLSEYAAVGYEYGYSVANKDALVLWEAQFGDFVNGAQIIIDQYLVAAEDKWGQTSGLVLLLPHGFEGQGPEHSSGPGRALPDAVRGGQHPGLQRHDRRAVLPPAAPTGASGRPQAAGAVHPQAALAHEGDPLADRGPDTGLVPGGARRSVGDRPRSGAPRDPLHGQGRLRRPRRAGQAPGAGGRGAGRADVPVPAGPDPRRARALLGDQGRRLAPGGAGEHGRLDLRRAPDLPHQAPGVRAAARDPGGVGEPGHRVGHHPRAGAGRSHGGRLPGSLSGDLRVALSRPFRLGCRRCPALGRGHGHPSPGPSRDCCRARPAGRGAPADPPPVRPRRPRRPRRAAPSSPRPPARRSSSGSSLPEPLRP